MVKKQIKILFLLITVIIFSQIVLSELCTERSVDGCTILTPNISCSTNYTIYNLTGDVEVNGGMTLVNDGIYKFDLNLNEGSYSILLCSGHTTDIEIISSEEQTSTKSDITSLNNSINDLNVSIDYDTVASSVWDYNLTENYPEAEDDNFIATLAGQQMVQALRFIIQLLFG